MNRRTLLKQLGKGLGSVAGAGALAGCFTPVPIGGPSGSGGAGSVGDVPSFSGGTMSTAINPQNYANYFDEIVDATDVDADPSGQESINPILNSHARPGTLLVFPKGQYLMTSPHRIDRSGPIGIIGQNAVIRHGTVESIDDDNVQGEYSGSSIMFNAGSADIPYSGFFVFGGFRFDFSPKNSGMQALNAHTTGDAVVENIQIYGQQDLGTHGPFRLSTQSNESVMLIRNIDMRHGGKHYVNTINTRSTPQRYGPDRPGPSWSTSGMTITSTMSGTMMASNIQCGPWPDNGLYLKGGTPDNNVGRKIVRNCQVANSNVSNLRINDGDDWVPHPWIDGDSSTPAQGYEHSVIENCRVTVTDNFDTDIYGNQLGIRLDDGAPILRNSRVILEQPNGTAVRVEDGVSGGQVNAVTVDLYDTERGIVVDGSADVANSVVNTIGFNSSSVVAGISSGVEVQQLAPSDVQPPQQGQGQASNQSQAAAQTQQ